ncbi:hypothetical protein Taro_031292, partial [Colocasia esculenta]|nr:hypothetical protein [Colocasia esculenta]
MEGACDSTHSPASPHVGGVQQLAGRSPVGRIHGSGDGGGPVGGCFSVRLSYLTLADGGARHAFSTQIWAPESPL